MQRPIHYATRAATSSARPPILSRAGGALARRLGVARGRARRPGPAPAPIVAQAVAHRLGGDPLRLAGRPRAGRGPSARCAASADECVQPEPCAAPSGMALARDLDQPLAVEEDVGRLLAVAAGDDHDRRARARGSRARARRRLRRPRRPRRRARAPRAGSASRPSRAAAGASRSASCGVLVEQPGAALGDHHRVEHDRDAADQVERLARRPRSSRAVPSMPILTASTPMSSATARTCATIASGGSG